MAEQMHISVPDVWNVAFSDFFAFLALANTESAYQRRYSEIMNRK